MPNLSAPLYSRRTLLKATGLGLTTLALTNPNAAAATASSVPGTSKKSGPFNPHQESWPCSERVGFAVVGLGKLSVNEVMPALALCGKAKAVALVSGDREKAQRVASQYGIKQEAIYTYENFDRISENPEIQVVYIVLPNHMHREFTERAAKAGKHVLCEKPAATNAADAQKMIEACRSANVKLMIAYRCQYEPYNMLVKEIVRAKTYGAVSVIDTTDMLNLTDPNAWRLKKGGGPLLDIGIYNINTTRFVLEEEPVEIFARTYSTPNDKRFTDVEERVTFMMRFPSGVIANCACSFGAGGGQYFRVHMEKGWVHLENAFAYGNQHLHLMHSDGSTQTIETKAPKAQNHFTLEFDHMAECVRENKTPHTPGEEGVQDHVIMEAIYASAKSGKPVML